MTTSVLLDSRFRGNDECLVRYFMYDTTFVAELLPERIKLNTTTFFIGLGIAFYVITCLAVFDIAKKDFGKLAYKFIWGMIAVIPFIGCIIYFVFGFRKGKRIEKYSNL